MAAPPTEVSRTLLLSALLWFLLTVDRNIGHSTASTSYSAETHVTDDGHAAVVDRTMYTGDSIVLKAEEPCLGSCFFYALYSNRALHSCDMSGGVLLQAGDEGSYKWRARRAGLHYFAWKAGRREDKCRKARVIVLGMPVLDDDDDDECDGRTLTCTLGRRLASQSGAEDRTAAERAPAAAPGLVSPPNHQNHHHRYHRSHKTARGSPASGPAYNDSRSPPPLTPPSLRVPPLSSMVPSPSAGAVVPASRPAASDTWPPPRLAPLSPWAPPLINVVPSPSATAESPASSPAASGAWPLPPLSSLTTPAPSISNVVPSPSPFAAAPAPPFAPAAGSPAPTLYVRLAPQLPPPAGIAPALPQPPAAVPSATVPPRASQGSFAPTPFTTYPPPPVGSRLPPFVPPFPAPSIINSPSPAPAVLSTPPAPPLPSPSPTAGVPTTSLPPLYYNTPARSPVESPVGYPTPQSTSPSSTDTLPPSPAADQGSSENAVGRVLVSQVPAVAVAVLLILLLPEHLMRE